MNSTEWSARSEMKFDMESCWSATEEAACEGPSRSSSSSSSSDEEPEEDDEEYAKARDGEKSDFPTSKLAL